MKQLKKISLLMLWLLSIKAFSQPGDPKEVYTKAAQFCEEAALKYEALGCLESAAYCRKMRDWNNCMLRNLANAGSCGLQPLPENAPKCEAANGDGSGGNNLNNRQSNTNVNHTTSSNYTNSSDAVGNAIGLTIDLINQSKRNKWNRQYLEKANEFQASYGITIDAIEKAIEENDIVAMKQMIEKRFDLNTDLINENQTLLYYATDKNRYEIVQMLISAGVDINKPNPKKPDFYAGITPLHAAAFDGNLDITKLLVENGANLNAQIDFWRTTPIDMAIKKNQIETVKYLKSKGADLSLTIKWESKSGIYKALTPYEYAVKLGNNEAAYVLSGY